VRGKHNEQSGADRDECVGPQPRHPRPVLALETDYGPEADSGSDTQQHFEGVHDSGSFLACAHKARQDEARKN